MYLRDRQPESYQSMTVPLKIGDKIEITELLKRFVELQYRRNDQNFIRGHFRVRGDNVEISRHITKTARGASHSSATKLKKSMSSIR